MVSMNFQGLERGLGTIIERVAARPVAVDVHEPGGQPRTPQINHLRLFIDACLSQV